ncbi:response regulator [Methyloversatilis thermotolerans]|uniref:response regulator n=1 Tax=Methyloversatilis thermotolerans TaxID=1346290 RepID=UPI0005917D27|nr:two-component system response regulator [Methyloversatilis thermotolerans]
MAQKTVLLVDDTPENLTVLGEILMPYYRVRVASSGSRALSAAMTDPRPDLVLLDVMMPDMDGYEVLRRLRQDPRTVDLPVIFVTALDTTEDEAHGLELGAVDYITKPVRPAIVLARVRGQLELKTSRDHARDHAQWLESEIARRIGQYRMMQDVSMRALASLAEARDNETGNHVLRTQNYVRTLAETLATRPGFRSLMTQERIDAMSRAAPLHDIGKVAIPDHILHKPGRLSEDEWAVMKTHARQGADAIWRAIRDHDRNEEREALDFLYVAMDIAAHHHERWDGSGYPDGLAGQDIPLAARLMALADVFDALISQRCYKPALPMEQAKSIICAGRGSHFDPDVVDAFLMRADNFAEIAARYADGRAA